MDADLVASVVPYLAAVATAYGTAVLDRVRDEAADATAEATVGGGSAVAAPHPASPGGWAGG